MVYAATHFYGPYCRASVQRYGEIAPYTSLHIIALSPQETTAICALWSGNLHLRFEDIYHLPVFEKTMWLKSTTFSHHRIHNFESLLT